MSKAIQYVKGDATNPQGPGKKIIAHVCNCEGGWGAGFVLAISAKWKEPERVYRDAFTRSPKPALGTVQYINVEAHITVANMIAQVLGDPTGVNIRYDELLKCMIRLGNDASRFGASIHAPRFGAGLAGGDWTVIEQMIQREWCDLGIDVTIYDFEPAKPGAKKAKPKPVEPPPEEDERGETGVWGVLD